MKRNLLFLLLSLAGLLQGCGRSVPEYHPAETPQRLSAWNLMTLAGNAVALNDSVLLFRPRNTLFSDYAHKMRFIWIPEGLQIKVAGDKLEYPVGTILGKTFYYPVNEQGDPVRRRDSGNLSRLSNREYHLIETRLLVRRQAGWEAFPYVWNEEQTEAFLRVAGSSMPVTLAEANGSRTFTYFVPNENQCSGCHTRVHPDGGLEPLGAIAHQLNYRLDTSGEEPQTVLARMQARGWLAAPPELSAVPSWDDDNFTLTERARAYLDINCGHCHNPDGAADTSALLLDGFDRTYRQMGMCKPPVAAGGGAGDRLFGIVPGSPEQSIMVYRMQSIAPDEMMPELGRTLVHEEGVALISEWIASLDGSCR